MAMQVCCRSEEEGRAIIPAKRIHHYLLRIQQHICQITKAPINHLTDSEFLESANLLDALYRMLYVTGFVMLSKKKTAALTTEDEDKF